MHRYPQPIRPIELPCPSGHGTFPVHDYGGMAWHPTQLCPGETPHFPAPHCPWSKQSAGDVLLALIGLPVQP